MGKTIPAGEHCEAGLADETLAFAAGEVRAMVDVHEVAHVRQERAIVRERRFEEALIVLVRAEAMLEGVDVAPGRTCAGTAATVGWFRRRCGWRPTFGRGAPPCGRPVTQRYPQG